MGFLWFCLKQDPKKFIDVKMSRVMWSKVYETLFGAIPLWEGRIEAEL